MRLKMLNKNLDVKIENKDQQLKQHIASRYLDKQENSISEVENIRTTRKRGTAAFTIIKRKSIGTLS